MRAAPIALVVLLAGCAAPLGPEAGETAAWSLQTLEGQTITPTSPARDATMLFFMATWCPTCRSQAPLVREVAEAYAGEGLATYSVGFDPSETPADIRGWQERHGHAWPHGLDVERDLQRALGVTAQSSVVVLAADGALVERFGYGAARGPELRAAVERALAGAAG